MQCRECGMTINPPAVLCPGCTYRASQLARLPKFTLATPSPSSIPVRVDTPAKARTDIGWKTFALIFLPLLALSCLFAAHKVSGDAAKMTGYAAGQIGMASAIAGLLSRLAKARFRLTLVVTLAVLEILPLLDSLPSAKSGHLAEGSSLQTPEANTVSTANRIDFAWPQGWSLQPVEPTGSGVAQKGMLLQNKRPVAVIAVIIGRGGPPRTLSEEGKIAAETATEVIEKAGGTVAWSTPRETSVGNVPAIEQEGTAVFGQRKVRELMISFDSPDRTLCGLVYSASAESFDVYRPQFDEAKKHFTCPNTSMAAASGHS